jgi:hypothetical protein
MKSTCAQCGKEINVTRRKSCYPEVCQSCDTVTCPICGHMAHWLYTRKDPRGRYVCFRAVPWCDWTSDSGSGNLPGAYVTGRAEKDK